MNRSRLAFPAALAAAVALTVFGGALQGRLSDRWGASDAARRAAETLPTIPARFGEWETLRTFRLRDRQQAELRTYGHVGRVFRHRQTGATVSLSLMVGPAGPCSVHTPEICLGGNEFRVHRGRAALEVPGRADRLWTTTFLGTDVEQRPVRVVYGWKAGEHWTAHEQPRLGYAGQPYLHRMNLSCAGEDEETLATCAQFLHDLLTAWRPEARS
jgi:hypothetical protein